MKFELNTTVCVIALAVATQAFTVPEGQPDGVYTHHVDEDGKDIHIRIADPVAHSAKFARMLTRRNLERRQFAGTTGCTGTTLPNSPEQDFSVSALQLQCGGFGGSGSITVDSGATTYSVSGSTVAFMCNYGGTNSCVSDEISAAMLQIGEACGDQTGWDWSDAWAKTYGVESTSSNICANSADCRGSGCTPFKKL